MNGAITIDGFLNGQVQAEQPEKGFRSGLDAVLLAAAVPAKPGQSVLELGSGAAVASLCLAARVQDLRITCVELQDNYADLARNNTKRNKAPIEVVNADIRDLPKAILSKSFDHVFCNPPYFRSGQITEPKDDNKSNAVREVAPLTTWIEVSTRRLVHGGFFTVIQRADRILDVVNGLDNRIGEIAIKPVCPRAGRDANLFILRGRKGSRGPTRILAPLVLHGGSSHSADGDDFTGEAAEILRCAAALSF